jgi:integrase
MRPKEEWKHVRGTCISLKPVLPGVWRRRGGGHVVRARAKDATTGRLREIWKVLPEADAATALKWLKDEQARVRVGVISAQPPKVRFSEFAASLFEAKVANGDIRSPKNREKWKDTLGHFIAGTRGKKSGRFVAGFGDYFVDRFHVTHVEAWKADMAGLINGGDYKPTTINGWLAILRVIVKAAKRKYSLSHLATEGVENFDTSESETYSEEEPNALSPDEVARFLAKFKELHPEHYGMVFLGLITGLRPSSLRPLRRRGAEADVNWETNRLFVRRSHTMGDETMRTTKQKRRYAIDLPNEAVDVLRWHVAMQLKTPEQQDSDLLFPAVNGRFRSPSVLNKPLNDVATELELGKKITQRALRRTFNDLARAAQVNDLVTRSISGHLTEQMQHHYSTVNGSEQREGIARVLRIVDGKPPERRGGEESGEVASRGGEGAKKAG